MVKSMLNPSNVLIAILIVAVAVDLVQMRIEIRKLRDYMRKTKPKLDPLIVELKCDSSDFMAKMSQATAAAQSAADQIAKLNGLTK
jgi:hypothetical protein